MLSTLWNSFFISNRKFNLSIENKKHTFYYQNDFSHSLSRSYVARDNDFTIVVNFSRPHKHTDIIFSIYYKDLVIFRSASCRKHFKDIKNIIDFNLNRTYYLFVLNEDILTSMSRNIHVRVRNTNYLDAYKHIMFYHSVNHWTLSILENNGVHADHLYFEYNNTLWSKMNPSAVETIDFRTPAIKNVLIYNRESIFHNLQYDGYMVKKEFRTAVSYAGALSVLDIVSNHDFYKVIKYAGNQNSIHIYKKIQGLPDELVFHSTKEARDDLKDFSYFDIFEEELINFFAKHLICRNYLKDMGLSHPLNDEGLELLKLMNY